MSEENEEWTPEEKRVLARAERQRGEEYVTENEALILAQARTVGDL